MIELGDRAVIYNPFSHYWWNIWVTVTSLEFDIHKKFLQFYK